MQSKLADALALRSSPVAVILTNTHPGDALQFQEGKWGCVGASMLAVSKGRTAVFDRKTFGCGGGGTGLGFGNQYEGTGLAIDCLLSTGSEEVASRMQRRTRMAEGERFFKSPEIVKQALKALPMRDVPSEYVVMRPLDQLAEGETAELVVFFVNADQLSALILMTDYDRGSGETATAPFGGVCQSILYGYAEAEREVSRGVIGFFDIAQRHRVERETLTYTIPWERFCAMDANVDESFLTMDDWQQLRERQ